MPLTASRKRSDPGQDQVAEVLPDEPPGDTTATARATPAAAVPLAPVVTIFGAGRVGTALAPILAPGTRAIRLVDLRSPTAAMPVILSDATRLTEAAAAAVAASACVVLALPFTAARDAVAGIAQHMAPGALLVETLSVKHGPASWAPQLRQDLEYLGLNPLFGPDLHWRKRPVVVVPHRDGPLSRAFTALIAGTGAEIVTLDAQTHDRVLAERQVASHALVLALGAVLAPPGTEELRLLQGPPPYQTLLMVLGRLLQGNSEVYAEIQAQNPFGAAVRERLIAALQALSGSEDEVATFIEGLRDRLGGPLDPAATACGRLFANRLFED